MVTVTVVLFHFIVEKRLAVVESLTFIITQDTIYLKKPYLEPEQKKWILLITPAIGSIFGFSDSKISADLAASLSELVHVNIPIFIFFFFWYDE